MIADKESCPKKPEAVQVASFPNAQTRFEVSSGLMKFPNAKCKDKIMSQILIPSNKRLYGVHRRALRALQTIQMMAQLPKILSTAEGIASIVIAMYFSSGRGCAMCSVIVAVCEQLMCTLVEATDVRLLVVVASATKLFWMAYSLLFDSLRRRGIDQCCIKKCFG
jgi:hypothetical protein